MPDDLEELKKRILALEEERASLKIILDGRADKIEIQRSIEGITKELAELRTLLPKKERPVPKDPLVVTPNPTLPKDKESSIAGGFW